MVALAALVGIGQASAQEGGGAGRIEVSAFPGGGVFFGRLLERDRAGLR